MGGVAPSGNPAYSAWAERRARLNHDVLYNRVLARVRAAMRAPDGTADESLRAVLRSLLARGDEYAVVLRECMEAVCPDAWFAKWLRLRDKQGDCAALADFVRRSFFATSDAPALVRDGEAALAQARAVVRGFLDGARDLGEVEAALTRLTSCISALPAGPLDAVESMYRPRK